MTRWLTFAILVLIGVPMTYSTARGYTLWYFVVPGATVTVDGKPADAWVHTGQTGLDVLVTKTEAGVRRTYVVLLPTKHVGLRCPVAPRFPIFAEGDLMNPDCLALVVAPGTAVPYNPPPRNLAVSEHSVAFTADDGKRLEAHW